MFVPILLLLHSFLPIVSPCHGGSGGCCVKQAPVVVNCGGGGGGGGCQQGYGCGQYGCAKRKAFGGLTQRIDGVLIDNDEIEEAQLADASIALRPENVQSNITIEHLMNPNFIFHSCCETRGLPDSCLHLCHFNTYTSDALEGMFHRTNDCPIEAINEIHYCAAQGIDHSACCASSGVSDTAAGEKCLAFCDQRPNRFTPIDSSYLPCFEVFENMKRCFFFEIKKRAQSKFAKTKFVETSKISGGFL